MQKSSLRCGMSVILVLLGLLAGCQGGGGSTESSGARTARVHIQVGDGTPVQRSTRALPSGVTRQRVGGIPPEVADITLRVTMNGQDIPKSPFPISLETGIASVDIKANVDHLFIIDINNHWKEIIFHGEATANLRPGAEVDLPITLVAQEVKQRVAMQDVDAGLGGEVVVTDPQSAVQGLRLVVASQALAQDTTFEILEVYNPTLVANTPLNAQPVLKSQAGVIVDLLQNGTTFAALATLEFPYNPTLVQDLGFSEASLRVWRFDTVAQQWVPVPHQTVDTTHHVIRAQLNSLSFYTVGELPSPPDSTSPFILGLSRLGDVSQRLR